MRLDKVILKKDGLWTSEWDRDTKKHVVERLNTDTHLFFQAWNVPLEIKGTVRLKDLLAYLKTLEPLVLDIIAKMTGANLEEYMKEDLVPERDPDRKSKLKYIEVYKYYELTNYDIETWDFTDHAVSAHGIGSPWEDGCEDVPLEKRGNSYAIEFTPWKYLLNLPLRLKLTTQITKTIYVRQKPKKMGFKRKGSKKFERGLSWVSDRKISKWEHQDVSVTYTLAEFFDGLLDELCFFWTPAKRDKEMNTLNERVESIKDSKDSDYSELVEE
jgi:hypothetical protein